ncbi:MAG: formylglycine-generating enzyme family protein [Aggregatilineales bacterium]
MDAAEQIPPWDPRLVTRLMEGSYAGSEMGRTLQFHELMPLVIEAEIVDELRLAMERGERPDRFFSNEWWAPRGYTKLFVILGKMKRDPNAVARWLAPVSPEVALAVILCDGNAWGLNIIDQIIAHLHSSRLAQVTSETKRVLIASAKALTTERDSRGRAAAYRVLAVFDADKRPGVGLRSDGLPDILWCPVKGGAFTMGGDPESYEIDDKGYPIENKARPAQVSDFQMSQYPVTYKQFHAFIDAEDGYRNPKWWEGLHADGLKQQKLRPRGPHEQQFEFWNHPRDSVSWYQAMAFCHWLSAKFGFEVRLPTEEEWERAARGTDGRFYPYGNEFDPAKGNTAETGIGQTSAVGMFPEGVSPYGVLDMSGNVMEWTLTGYTSRMSNKLDSSEARGVRGGFWNDGSRWSRAASRRGISPNVPDFRDGAFGFRLVATRGR